MIIFIKTIHTAIWAIMTMAIFYIGYSVIRMSFNGLFFVSLFLIATEILVILANAWSCPLTGIARRYSHEDTPNFDIYLPRTIAKFNKEIFSIVLLVIVLLYVYNSTT